MDLKDEANRMTFTTLFVQQSAPDVRRKLQKVDVMSGMLSVSQLIEIAYKVYNNREESGEKRKNTEKK